MPSTEFVRVAALVMAVCIGTACKNEASDAPSAKTEASAVASVKPVESVQPPPEAASAAPSASPAPSASAAVAPAPVVPIELTAKSPDEDVAAVGKRLLAMLEASATMLTTSEGDCAKIAAGYDAVLADHATVVAEIKAFAKNRPAKKRVEKWLEANSGDLMTRVAKAGAATSKCKKDKDFKAASNRFMNAMRGR